MSPEVVRAAIISLVSKAEGGLRSQLVSGTRSLLVTFGLTDDGDQPLYWGVEIRTTDGVSLPVGAPDRLVQLRFWAPEVEPLARVGAEFRLWSGHDVGSGRIVASDWQAEDGERMPQPDESPLE